MIYSMKSLKTSATLFPLWLLIGVLIYAFFSYGSIRNIETKKEMLKAKADKIKLENQAIKFICFCCIFLFCFCELILSIKPSRKAPIRKNGKVIITDAVINALNLFEFFGYFFKNFKLWQNTHSIQHLNLFKVYRSVTLHAFTLLCNQSPAYFSSCRTKALYPLNTSFHCPFSQPLATTILLSVSMGLPIADISCK